MKTKALLLLLVVGCGVPPVEELSSNTSTIAVVENPAPPEQPVLTGFPCEVRSVLQSSCAGCHTGQLYVIGFESRADFLQNMGSEGTFGQMVASRLASTDRPMPPSAAEHQPSADERATVSAWIEGGMPPGACGDLTRP